MSQDELAVMENSKCILQLRGERPFLSDKYNIVKHPKYLELSDSDPNLFFKIDNVLDDKSGQWQFQETGVFSLSSVE